MTEVCWQAADAIMECYYEDFDYAKKKDGSPLTKADLASHHIIATALAVLTPNIQVISEESGELIDADELDHEFWLVDPLDGTKEFIKRSDEFTVNIALVRNKEPILGLVCCPALDEIYVGQAGYGSYKKKRYGKQIELKIEPHQPEEYVIISSRSHGNQEAMDEFLKGVKVKEFLSAGSSLKFCRVAEGKAHLYPRLGRTMEWDTAAGHAILSSAGGEVRKLDNQMLYYGKSGLENPHFLACIKGALL
nr:3'(2'),5'-bisphosphate nucleotidase CysQ [Legionella pneumophila]